jgi:outer membrane lipoprotein-sorting protein
MKEWAFMLSRFSKSFKTKSFAVGLLALAMIASSSAFAADLAPEQILKKADDIRNPADSFFMKVQILNPSNPDDSSTHEVSLKGKDKTLTKTVAPARDRGRNMLMLGEEMWAYVPNLNRAVRVSLNQKLNGQAANGDITRTRWAGDYSTKIESQSASEWTLFLEANKKGLTYDKIRVWLSKADFKPLRAEYLSLSGKVLKKVTYQNYKNLAGGMRPSEILIQDAVRTDEKSLIKIISMEVRSFPDSLFNQNNLK